MDRLDILCGFLHRVERDARIGPVHISLYTAIFKYWSDQGCSEVIAVTRKELMAIAKIASKKTYSRTVQDLDDFGYIAYERTYSRWYQNKFKLFVQE